MIGIEHEFRVRDSYGHQLDFEPLCARLSIDGLQVDVLDRSAWRTGDGFLICADGAEAEIATPPLEPAVGIAEIAAQAGRAARVLQAALPVGLRLEGYSTHISVSVDDEIVADVAHLFAQSYAPALMLLLDDRESPGLLVRPRHGRLELGGVYRGGAALEPVLAMALGGARHCAAAVRARDLDGFAPLVRVRTEWADQRFGWYVDRQAFGPDLYRDGRRAKLQRRSRGRTTAQEQLVACWDSARAWLGDLDSSDLDGTGRVVSGAGPLPSERAVDRGPAFDDGAPLPTPIGVMTRTHRVNEVALEPVIVGWDLVVYRSESGRVLAVPGSAFVPFVEALEAGQLDRWAGELPSHRGLLEDRADLEVPGWFDGVFDRRLLSPPERSVSTVEREVA